MKRFILTFILFLFAITLMAQVPAGFSYQAVVRNNSGEIVASKTVKFRFSILQNSSTGDVGMIAEEVGVVLPEIVIYEENGIDAKVWTTAK
jgi:hypothetical protein